MPLAPKKRPSLTSLKPRIGMAAVSLTATTCSAATWRAGKTSTERGYGYAWQQARARFLKRHPLCLYCEREGRVTAATIVDHIEPHRGDEALFWRVSNWQPLCKPHHDGDKRREEASGVPAT